MAGDPSEVLDPSKDAGQHLTRDLSRRVRVRQQLLDLTVHEFATLGQLVASTIGEVLTNAARVRLSRTAREVAMLDEVGETLVDDVPVELESLCGKALGHFLRRLIGEEATHPGREEPHDGEVGGRLLVDRISQRPERLALVRVQHAFGHGRHGSCDRRRKLRLPVTASGWAPGFEPESTRLRSAFPRSDSRGESRSVMG
ncbi:MAG TPA: hypothetical protein PK324_00465 [Nocardioides sp.]|nr:hypothetical protein [Nocardioides sp.]